MTGFLLGAAAMFAVTYSTQAILPELGRAFDVSPAEAGSTISVVVLALAVGAWIWGPLSDRYGRKRSIVLASTLVVAPTIGAAVAPTFALLLVCRALQGLCMPGLLTAGVPYITEVFVPRLGGRAMGSYVAALIAGGLIGRVGVALLADAVGWRWAIGLLALLPLTAAILMRRSLLDVPPAEPTTSRRWSAARTQLRNRELLKTTAAGSAFFFTFVGTFSYVVFRLERPPFSFGSAAGSLVFALWLLGVLGPTLGALADRIGWRTLAFAAFAVAAAGLALTIPAWLPTLVLGLALVTLANWAGVTAAQIGIMAAAGSDRGTATAVYFSIYYLCGAVGGYLPGLAWEHHGWGGVVACGWLALAVAAATLSAGHVRRAP